MRFSEYFELNKKQNELDFVDVPLDTDIPLFIDPFVLSKREDLFSIEASQTVSSFFQEVVNKIRNGDNSLAQKMLAQLKEPNDTHLGLSTDKSQGKGVSGKQALDLFLALKNSRAVQTGFIKDIQDCELVIPGIGDDKISDVVTNLIKILLIGYTKDQCDLFGIPTEKVSAGTYWNATEREWTDSFVELPVVNIDGKKSRVILVPKSFTRYNMVFNHAKYYNGFVLEYLQRQFIREGSSLVHILKNGSPKVYKKDLKTLPEYKLTKEFLYRFSNENPQVLDSYRSYMEQIKIEPITDTKIEEKQNKQNKFDYDVLVSKLKSIDSGIAAASVYHDHIIGVLTAIFSPHLVNPKKEQPIHEGRKKIDISFNNAAQEGFFFNVSNKGIPSIKVFFECKNLSKDVKNPELDQLAGRFSPRRGKLGFIVCRSVEDKEKLIKRCRDAANDDRGVILVLDDNDIIELIGYKKLSDEGKINDFLHSKIDEILL
jgi:hypothetical protein